MIFNLQYYVNNISNRAFYKITSLRAPFYIFINRCVCSIKEIIVVINKSLINPCTHNILLHFSTNLLLQLNIIDPTHQSNIGLLINLLDLHFLPPIKGNLNFKILLSTLLAVYRGLKLRVFLLVMINHIQELIQTHLIKVSTKSTVPHLLNKDILLI